MFRYLIYKTPNASKKAFTASNNKIPAPTHSAYFPKIFPSVFPKNRASVTNKKVTPAIIETAIKTEKVKSINVTPIANASMLVATACRITKDNVKADFLLQLSLVIISSLLSFIISTMIFMANIKKIVVVKYLAIDAKTEEKSEPTKYPISGITPWNMAKVMGIDHSCALVKQFLWVEQFAMVTAHASMAKTKPIKTIS